MNLATVHTFLMILETGNLNRAAERLNVTQSTVTARLNTLEQELGQPLFTRRKSGAELTSAGFKFQRYAELMTDLWRQAQQETSLPSEVDAVCNLGCSYDLWPSHGRRLFDSIRATAPSIALSAWPGEQASIERWLSSGLIDAALCHSPALRENWTAHRIYEEPLLLVSTEPRALMRWDPLYVYVDMGEEFRRAHATAYPDGDTPTTIFGSALWGLEHILDRGGSAYLPESLVHGRIKDGSLHLVPSAPIFHRTCFLVVNSTVAGSWPWLEDVLSRMQLQH